jgi:uncharacterized BrkB/YihY/UPF0761 family membrane protein
MAFARFTRDNRRVITAAAQAGPLSSTAVGPAVLIVIAVIIIWRYAVPRGKEAKGTIPGRLLAVILFLVGCWVLLAVTHPATAMQVAGGTASGITTLFNAAARIL